MRAPAALAAFLSVGMLCSAASFTTPHDMPSTYRQVLNEVKREGFSVESASPDAGIRTALTVTGHYHQTGSYLNIQFVSAGSIDSAINGIKISQQATTVEVSVMEEKRYKALQTEPWSTPKVNGQRSVAEARQLQKGMGN